MKNTYFTGMACKRGHIAPRYKSNRGCVVCEHIRKYGYAGISTEISVDGDTIIIDRYFNGNKIKSVDVQMGV